ncbi:glycosyl hydrolase family 18 protein [Bacillus haimaensis]|uniref:glycosyl hydrolase family 18 protein n=1 Tax=Bacillus haimaensis TaxID=3160967 RepID=UPI003AA87250
MQRRRKKHNSMKWIGILLITILIVSVVIVLTTDNPENDSPNTSRVTATEKETIDQPPQISEITAESDSTEENSVGGDVKLSVNATDDQDISKVEFYSNNGEYLIGTVTSEPYTINWATESWVPDGEQILKVIAYDDSNQKTEVIKNVMVKNPEPVSAKLVGYYAGWAAYSGYEVADIDASKLTHINYAFANITKDGKIAVGDSSTDVKNFHQLNKLKEQHPHIKTLISIGGWTWSENFSDAALTEDSRARFAESVRQFLLDYGFDGVDLDWEYPVSGGEADNTNRPEDKRNYTLLLKKIRETLDEQSEKDDKEYLLTIAAGASKAHAANLELTEIHPYLDYIQLMTYDIHGEWDPLSGLNAPLHQDPASGFHGEWSVGDGVQTYINGGVPPEKLVMGLPFYGRVFKQVDDTSNNGLYKSFSGGGTSLSYAKIASDYVNQNGFSRVWIEDSKVPLLFDGTTVVSYDDQESIGHKTAFIKEKGLGGAMMWELSQDPDEVLLKKIYDDMKDE